MNLFVLHKIMLKFHDIETKQQQKKKDGTAKLNIFNCKKTTYSNNNNNFPVENNSSSKYHRNNKRNNTHKRNRKGKILWEKLNAFKLFLSFYRLNNPPSTIIYHLPHII